MTCGTCEMSHDIESWKVIFTLHIFALSALPSRCSCVARRDSRILGLPESVSKSSNSPFLCRLDSSCGFRTFAHRCHDAGILHIRLPVISHLAADFDLCLSCFDLLQKWLALWMRSWCVCVCVCLLASKYFLIARKMLAKQGILGTFSCRWWRQYGQCLQCLCLVFAGAFAFLTPVLYLFTMSWKEHAWVRFGPYSFIISFLSVPHVEVLFFLLSLAIQMVSSHSTASSIGRLSYAMVLRFGHHFNSIRESFSGRLFALAFAFFRCRTRRCRRSARRAAWTMLFRRSFVRSWWAIKRVLVLWEFGISMVANFK